MKRKDELIAHCKTALKNKVQYVYGAKMQVLSLAQIKSLQSIYGKSYVWDSDLKKAGKLCCDCSGLISSLTGIVRNSSMYKATAISAVSIAEFKKDPSKYVGWGLWMQGHIGVASDTLGYYYAMDGSARNMSHLPLSKQNWSMAIKLCDIDYSVQKEKEVVIKENKVEKTKIVVNGKIYETERILKDSSNYVKLADFAKMGFVVDYESATKMPALANKITTEEIYFDGRKETVENINIGGFNYVKLRDFIEKIGGYEISLEQKKICINKEE